MLCLLELAFHHVDGQDLAIMRKAMVVQSMTGVNANVLTVAANVIARKDPAAAIAMLQMIKGRSELAKATISKIEGLGGRGNADKVFAVLMQAAQAMEKGTTVKRFTGNMPRDYVAANDDRKVAVAV